MNYRSHITADQGPRHEFAAGGGGARDGGLDVEVPRNRGSGAEPPSGVLGRSPGWRSGGKALGFFYGLKCDFVNLL